MKRKILITILIVSIVSLSFLAGYRFSSYRESSAFKASLGPAEQFIYALQSGKDIDKTYENTSNLFRETHSIEAVRRDAETLKESELENNDVYEGAYGNQVYYTLKSKNGKRYDVLLNVTKEDKWQLDSYLVQESVLEPASETN